LEMEQDQGGVAVQDRAVVWDEAVVWAAVEEWAVETVRVPGREVFVFVQAAATGLPTRQELPAIR